MVSKHKSTVWKLARSWTNKDFKTHLNSIRSTHCYKPKHSSEECWNPLDIKQSLDTAISKPNLNNIRKTIIRYNEIKPEQYQKQSSETKTSKRHLKTIRKIIRFKDHQNKGKTILETNMAAGSDLGIFLVLYLSSLAFLIVGVVRTFCFGCCELQKSILQHNPWDFKGALIVPRKTIYSFSKTHRC